MYFGFMNVIVLHSGYRHASASAYNLLKYQLMYFGFMNVIVLHNGYRHASASRVAIFAVVRIMFYHYTGILTKKYTGFNRGVFPTVNIFVFLLLPPF
jgi:hypothetical protein